MFLVKKKKLHKTKPKLKAYFLGAEWHNFSEKKFSPFFTQKKNHTENDDSSILYCLIKNENNLDLLAVFEEKKKKCVFFCNNEFERSKYDVYFDTYNRK